MTESLQPFYRPPEPPEPEEPTGWHGWTMAAMQVHFLLAGLGLAVGAAGLLGYLYWLELRRADLGWGLRFGRPGDMYQPGVQALFGLLLLLGLASLIQVRAANVLVRRSRTGLWLVGLAALMLLVAGLPISAFVWWMADHASSAAGGGRLVEQNIHRYSGWVRALAGLVLGQSLLALGYLAALILGVVRRVCRERSVTNPAVARLQVAGAILWVALLAGLGVGLGMATGELYEWPVAEPDPGALLYATTFDRFNEEWDLYGGRDAATVTGAAGLGLTAVSNGSTPVQGAALAVTYGSPETNKVAWSVLDRTYRDMDLRVTAQRVSGPLDNQLGVMFRYRDDENFYVFRISSDGYYSLEKVQDGIPQTISEWGLSDMVRQGDAANTVRVVARGDAFRFYVNGQPVPLCFKGEFENSMWAEPGECMTAEPTFIYRDGDFRQGRVALAAGSSSDTSEPVVVAFDDVVIVGPQPDVMETDSGVIAE